jgi:hypothetical protein
MARLVRLKPLVHRRLRALGVRRASRSSAAIGATIASLAEAGKLPGVLDTASMVPTTTTAFVRRVAGHNLWLWYQATADEVTIITVTNTPPVPLDD